MRSCWQDKTFARHGNDWSEEEKRLLVESLAAGMTIREVAAKLQRSQTAVHSKAVVMGLGSKRTRRASPRDQSRRSASFFLS